MLETLFSGLLGGALRLAPEAMKLFDRRNERDHELKMLTAEMDFAKIKNEAVMRQADAQVDLAEVEAVVTAMRDQTASAISAGGFAATVSALVRPTITFAFLGLYVAVKIASFLIALQQGGNWENVVVRMWGPIDMNVFSTILSFWFVGRIYERNK